MANYYVQNLVRPEEGSQIIAGNTYTVSFYNPYTMYVSSWNTESDNFIKLWYYDNEGYPHSDPPLKKQTVVTGQNTFTFRLSDYGLSPDNIYSEDGVYYIFVEMSAYILENGKFYQLFFTSDEIIKYQYGNVVFYMACGAPTACSVSSTLATGDVTLSWSGASAGTSNSITGYKIQRCESSDGSSWESWADLTTVSSTSTSASLTVSPPSTAGNYYKYRVLTMGSAGSSYYSGWLESSNSLRRDHTPLEGFTDDPLMVGVSPVKALHMQELQSHVNTLYAFYGLGTYNFTTITAGTTSLAGWTTHVNQIRAAIEDVCNASGKTHENWISFSVNCPRADVIQQLRSVILTL